MKKIKSFNFKLGDKLNGKYEIIELLGKGWEGEVYLVKEVKTGIERTAKFFFPKRNIGEKASKFYAKKLHKLKNCNMIIQYHFQDIMHINDVPVTFLISEFVEGELLSEFLKKQPGKRIQPFMALHLLHALAEGLEEIHNLREYHGDLHTENIIVNQAGIGFEAKFLDLYNWGTKSGEHIKDDVVDLIKIFHELLGGKKHYAKLPNEVKSICCGLKRSLILKKFKTAGKLKEYLENIDWN